MSTHFDPPGDRSPPSRQLEQALDELAKADALRRSILTSLDDQLAVLDRDGEIIAVNDAWSEFAGANGGDPAKIGVGVNYLDACSAGAEEDRNAARILSGIRSVLDGSRSSYRQDYPCHSPSEKRWFSMSVTPLEGQGGGAVIVHTDVTDRVLQRRRLEETLSELAELKERLAAENVYLREEIGETVHYEDMVGDSPPWRRVLEQLEAVAAADTPVLLTGETGTGKELVARAIHAHSGRRERPLIKVNCAALPSTLIESELFGHEKGAFSGADARRRGRFELAHQGTLFLDEIGEMPIDLQAKLLHVLEGGEFERLGSSKTRRADVRVIAATNREFPRAIDDGRIRSDLYYRLAVFPLELPPLRRRPGDVELLAAFFLTRSNARHGRSIDAVSRASIGALSAYDWPGNVRELENLIERAVLLSPGNTLRLDGLLGLPPASPGDPSPVRSAAARAAAGAAASGAANPGATLEEMERAHILGVLEACGFKVKGKGNAAERLGLKESTLRSRMKKLGIRRPGS